MNQTIRQRPESPAADCPQSVSKKQHLQQHLAYIFGQDSGKKTMIVAHRGGFLGGPENSLKAFQSAIDNDIEAIEFDVWLSKDNILMVLHGGDDGELNHYGHDGELIFKWTADELQSRIDLGEGQRIPTLESVLQLCQESPKMLLNIELKGPQDAEFVEQYDHNLAARKVVQLINQFDIARKVMISSFNTEVLYSVTSVSPSTRQFLIQRLTNFYVDDDRTDYKVFDQHTGVNIHQEFLTNDRVNKIRNDDNSLVGVWYVASDTPENEHMWRKAFTTGGGVDFFYSDRPLEAMQARDQMQS